MPHTFNHEESQQLLASYINPRQRFNATFHEAIKAFARSKPWQGAREEQQAKFSTLHAIIMQVYSVRHTLEFVAPEEPDSDVKIDDVAGKIILRGRLSVLNYLLVVGKARGMNAPLNWALTVFKRYFPRSFANAQIIDGKLSKRAL